MNPYLGEVCSKCGRPAIGLATNFKIVRYYCNSHWWVMNAKWDKWVKTREDKQFAGQAWYDEGTSKKSKRRTKATKEIDMFEGLRH